MEKKLVICVDESFYAKYTAKYCAQLALETGALKIVLFNVQEAISYFLLDECQKNLHMRSELKKALAQNKDKSEGILNQLKEEMVSIGIREDNISIKSQPRDMGVAKDILKFAEASHCDAVVMGRRGISGLQELFMGSVTNSIIQNGTYLPIWLINSGVTPKNILVPVDGSDSALRAIDHLAFMVKGSENIRLTLFHVTPHLRNLCKIDFSAEMVAEMEEVIKKFDQRWLDNFYPQVVEKFSEFNIPSERIVIKVIDGKSVRNSIFKEINEGGYDTIVLGRKGQSKRFFTGSVSNYLINKISDQAIWLVP